MAGGPADVPAVQLHDARQSLGPATLDDLFPDGPAFRRSVVTFTVLLALASLIATFGLIQDSVAAIIGAMVVAPLGGAMMALAGALVTGRSRWQLNSLVEVVLGALMVVAIGYGVSALLPDPLTLNPSLAARTNPGLLDLGVALAAGAAGAFVTVRRTGTDALPGVAIAVSLVPPLATVGICAELGRFDDAVGALTLFLTNFAAIVVVASIVFALSGVRPVPTPADAGRVLVRGLAVAVIGLALISIPLVVDAAVSVRTVVWSNAAAPVVEGWAEPQQLRVVDWSVDGASVRIDVAGPDEPVGVDGLAQDVATAIGEPIELALSWVAEQRTVVPASP
jgi:uncharacterized hydrophobic protein (TIGR00271 family)